MRSGFGIWVLGLVASVLLHLGAGAGLMAALQPQPVADQPVPESRLNVEAQQVERSEASERATESERTETEETKGASLGGSAIAQSVAAPLATPFETAPARTTPAEAAPVQDTPALPVERSDPADRAERAPATLAEPAEALSVTPAAFAALPATPTVDQSEAEVPAPLMMAAAALRPAAVLPDAPTPASAPPVAPTAAAAAPRAPPSIATPESAPHVTASKAVLAFPAEGSVDPKSLAAFQSFTQPGSAEGADVRDSLAAALSVPCSRMQVIFDPDTTTLTLTGHVPDPGQRAPVLQALQAQMGADIAVADNLLILPAPQCAALSGIADVGLPQSTDQITNPLIVGSDTHARAFRYVKDEALVIDMTGPDYPAYVYVDYFDAGGNVIHLMPNDRAPLQQVPAKGPIRIGARSAEEPGLFVRIGPPYGQEIAAAFAASAPLYDGLRPLVEPADAYLAWLQTRVVQARAADPEFKGEWVYFFVTTASQ
ncbi:DUF4384 domain-containing protein [Marimonas sp. MJW-29]|uniref:DUF4384 domain-containing protein n=1 Tax=Sulfitobacter sediminis TaxID=3234186 RepID=A0ABV3RRS7_9RHOB